MRARVNDLMTLFPSLLSWPGREPVPGEFDYPCMTALYVAAATDGMMVPSALLVSLLREPCRCLPSPGCHCRRAIQVIQPGWLH